MSYRVQYSEIKPGGHIDRQDELLTCDLLSEVWTYLAQYDVVPDTIVITNYAAADGIGRVVYPSGADYQTRFLAMTAAIGEENPSARADDARLMGEIDTCEYWSAIDLMGENAEINAENRLATDLDRPVTSKDATSPGYWYRALRSLENLMDEYDVTLKLADDATENDPRYVWISVPPVSQLGEALYHL